MTDFNSNSGAVRQELPPIYCHVCAGPLGVEWVYVSARNLAGRLYELNLCGVCWPLLKAVVQTEVEHGERSPIYRAGASPEPPPDPPPRRRRRTR